MKVVLPESLEEIRDEWSGWDEDTRVEYFRKLSRDHRELLFLDLTSADQCELIQTMPPHERRTYLRVLPPDDTADVIQQVPADEREELLDLLDYNGRREVAALLAYAEDEAGGLMNPRFPRLRPEMTVDEAITYLRLQGRSMEQIYYAYVLDADQNLQGVVSFRDLFSSAGASRVRDIMRREFIHVTDDMDQEEVARVFSTHGLLAVPVLDQEGRMEGIVTVDDIVQVVQEEASEDIHKIGGMEALESPYLETGFWEMSRKRAGWLAVLFLGEMLTASAMSAYEDEIARAVVLVVFIPLIISSGGNSGSQASTLIIRALALGDVRAGDWPRVLKRELISGVALGGILAILGFVRVVVGNWLTGSYGEAAVGIGITVGLALVGVILFGTVAGSMLPFILSRLKLDPASASAPFVATLVDVSGLIIYFTVASWILKGTLL